MAQPRPVQNRRDRNRRQLISIKQTAWGSDVPFLWLPTVVVAHPQEQAGLVTAESASG
jgi:hypothetical protein